ncbi:MAG: MBL fold metallo-hydrolase, partial [Eubacteriales bacterium]|nr:MBL fold metallo-hydrolase [Eubacteriales bacterium]
VCQSARQTRQTPRKRSAMLLNPQTLFDFGPDVMAASQMYDRPFHQLKRIFLTHTHEDHCCFANLEVLTMTDDWAGKRLDVYLSPAAHRWVYAYLDAVRPVYRGDIGLERLLHKGDIRFCPVTPYQPFTVDDLSVFAVESNHKVTASQEYALNYMVTTPEGQKVLYVCDSGLYDAKNYQALSGAALTHLVMECTFGSADLPADSTHLNAAHFVSMVGQMQQHGIVNGDTRIYATHINQVQHYNHQQLQAYMDAHSPLPVTVARDGMEG